MGGRTLEGIEVHLCRLRSIGCEEKWSDWVLPEKESAEHWTHAAIGTYVLPTFGGVASVWRVRITPSLVIA